MNLQPGEFYGFIADGNEHEILKSKFHIDGEFCEENFDFPKKQRKQVSLQLEGTWREKQLFELGLAHEHYVFLQQQLEKCHVASKRAIDRMDDGTVVPEKEIRPGRKQRRQPRFNVERSLYLALGAEVTKMGYNV